MTNNGKPIDLVRVTLKDGKMAVSFSGNMALVSHAIRMASLELDNQIIANDVKQAEEGIQVPGGLIR